MTTTTAYDGVAYPSLVHFQTHPNRIAAQAALYGMSPAPPERCRVLELGCGDGANLISMAFDLPDGAFVGIDLAANPVARGNERVGRLGLRNVSLRQGDVAAVSPADLGTFDYVVAHGLYSWVPEPVRGAVLALCGAVLAPHGVAFVSYNALPGGYVRQMVREMMRYHVGRFARHHPDAGPAERVREARGLLAFLAAAQAEFGGGAGGRPGDDYAAALRRYGGHVRAKADGTLFHDELGEENAPFYLHEFAAQAARHGLACVCEAEYADSHDHGLAPPVRETIRQYAGDEAVAVGQYADFVRGPTFHKTLLCRREANPAAAPDPRRLFDLYAASPARVVWAGPGAFRQYRGTRPGARPFATDDPVTQAALAALGGSWPRPLHFQEIAAAARGTLADPPDDDAVARALLAACDQSTVDLFARRPAVVARATDRPVASRLARRQAEFGAQATNLLGVTVALDSPAARALLALLDGSRDRAALLRDLAAPSRAAGPPPPGWLDRQLAAFARQALLTA